MKFSKVIALGAVLAASSSIAFASPITGTVGFSGSGTYTGGSTGTFTPNPATGTNAVVLQAGTGSLAPFVLLTPATFSGFTAGSIATGATLFTSTVGGVTLSFTYGDTTAGSVDPTGNGIDITGTLRETGFDNTSAMLDISANGVATLFTAGVLPAAATPEPSSLLLLGTGLLGAASAAFRKRSLIS